MASENVQRTGALPVSKAVQISISSMRTRFTRSVLNAGVVALSVAFFAYVLVSGASSPEGPGNRTLLWSVLLSILVAAVGITNSFLITVSERFREIGTLKCLGARDRFVILIVVLEALFVGVAGSLAGSTAGGLSGVYWPMEKLLPGQIAPPLTVAVVPILWGLALGTGLSLFGAILPAMAAAKMAPAEAMRVEV